MSLKSSFNSNSTKLLIFSNLVTIVAALYFGWNLFILLAIYWFQSVTIGFFNFLKILYLKQSPLLTRIFSCLFFAFHYGFFHFVYIIFIVVFYMLNEFMSTVDGGTYSVNSLSSFFNLTGGVAASSISLMDGIFIPLIFILFFINHFYSFQTYKKNLGKTKHTIASLMFMPYLRIFPMHLTIIFGFGFLMSSLGKGALAGTDWIALLLFLVLKAATDVIAHVYEHKDDD